MTNEPKPPTASYPLSASNGDFRQLGIGGRNSQQSKAARPSERARASHWARVRCRLLFLLMILILLLIPFPLPHSLNTNHPPPKPVTEHHQRTAARFSLSPR